MDSKTPPTPNNSFNSTDKILCCYINKSKSIQIARISNVSSYYYERVIFPGDNHLFEAHPNDFLEIHSGANISSFLSDKILCSRLIVNRID